jgi:hypothetical protein
MKFRNKGTKELGITNYEFRRVNEVKEFREVKEYRRHCTCQDL